MQFLMGIASNNRFNWPQATSAPPVKRMFGRAPRAVMGAI
jgi:hypothetical protein